MELAVDTVALLVDQLEGVAAVAVHVPEAIGDAPVAKEERDLVRGLRTEGDEVPKHVHVLRIHRGGGGGAFGVEHINMYRQWNLR